MGNVVIQTKIYIKDHGQRQKQIEGIKIGVGDVVEDDRSREDLSIDRIGKGFKKTSQHDTKAHQRIDAVFGTITQDLGV
jgi:hypothetical protein